MLVEINKAPQERHDVEKQLEQHQVDIVSLTQEQGVPSKDQESWLPSAKGQIIKWSS